MKEKNIAPEQIREQLTKVFGSAEMSAVYNSYNEQYTGLRGWCGIMSPESRPAYIKTFGASVVAEAEEGARAELVNIVHEYERSCWAGYKHEADKHRAAGHPVPALGAYVWGTCSLLKCDSGKGYRDEIRARVEMSDEVAKPVLLHIEKVVTVTAAELDRGELADELCAAETMPGGGCYEDNERLQMVAPYRLSYSKVTAVTDGKRYYYIDSEGYDYARYIALPDDWANMFATALQDERDREAARVAAEKAEIDAKRADALKDYAARCDKWAHLMQPVADLIEAEKNSKSGTPEQKAARRKLQAARRSNILAMCRAAFPDLKFRVTASKGWGEDWELIYTDGPTAEAFEAATDLDLFATHHDTFDGWDDSTDVVFVSEELSTFARDYMGRECGGGVKVSREMSDATAAALKAHVIEALPALADGNSIHRDVLTDVQRAAVEKIAPHDWGRAWYHADSLARDIFDVTDYYTAPEPSSPIDSDLGGKGDHVKKANATPTNATDDVPAEGLTLTDTPDGVAVVGDSRTTYRNRKAIKAHGATWNKAAGRWEATAPEDVQRLRDWFCAIETQPATTDPAAA
jgi:hypothetical protein